uniref:Zinc finger CCCH domain-containing protein 10 n=1 Tax=Petromyzon marinus TaxID=7757 RepID=A0AAJ7WKD6_PETMA|nr:zinc finger CCCH domain-containing protein 10 isoform X2 [Petromyzon marinus]
MPILMRTTEYKTLPIGVIKSKSSSSCGSRGGGGGPRRSGARDSSSNLNGVSDGTGEFTEGGMCRDFLRNVCKRGKHCRYHHPEFSEVINMGVRRNELSFCHDFQNGSCTRPNCKFVHSPKQDEEFYRRHGELPAHLKQTVAAGLGLSLRDLQLRQGEVPVCHDNLNNGCLRGKRCKFRHVTREEFTLEMGLCGHAGAPDATAVTILPPPPAMPATMMPRYRFDGFGEAFEEERFVEFELARAKRRRLEEPWAERFEHPLPTLRLADTQLLLLQEENIMLRRRMEELRKQAVDLTAVNEALLEQNARLRVQAGKVVTLTSAEQTLVPRAPTVVVAAAAMPSYSHALGQPLTTLSGQTLQGRPVSQQELVAPSGAPTAQASNPGAPPPQPVAPPHLNPEALAPLPATLGLAPAVSLATVAVSVAPVVSMAQSLSGITMSHATTPIMTFPIATQSIHMTSLPH